MSYDIELRDPVTKEIIEFDHTHYIKGGIYQVGGVNHACLNITYNYASTFENVLGKNGIRTIYEMSGAESIPLIKKAINKLTDDVDPDYWKTTEGNAKQALHGLLAFAEMRPDGIWNGD